MIGHAPGRSASALPQKYTDVHVPDSLPVSVTTLLFNAFPRNKEMFGMLQLRRGCSRNSENTVALGEVKQ